MCSGLITLHCIVWAAILFPGHPYIESATALSDTAIVISAAEGIVKSYNSGLLESNGGHIKCTKHWAKHFLTRLGYVKLNEKPPQKHQYLLLILKHKRNSFYLIFEPLLRWRIFQMN